jgi:hypothetical protein
MRIIATVALLVPFIASAQNVVTHPSGSQTIAQPANTSLNVNSFEQIRFADQFTGTGSNDIFDKANAAASSLSGGPGVVVVPPGSYQNVTTTLDCASNVVLAGNGVTINYTGSGIAIYCADALHATVEGFHLVGPGTGGSTIGLQVGATGSQGKGIGTVWNAFSNIHIEQFYTGVKVDGSAANPPNPVNPNVTVMTPPNCTTGNGNGTYTNTFSSITVIHTYIGWDLRPTCPGYAAGNTFVGSDVENSGNDGLVIDGSNGNWFFGFRSENNTHYGVNFSGVQQLTNGNVFSGGWFESNGAGDMNFGSASNVVRTRVYGPAFNSTPQVTGNPGGLLNEILKGSSGYSNDYYAGPFQYHITAASGNAVYPWTVNNDENPPSGQTNVVAIKRTGANAGSVVLGTPEYPVTVNSNLQVNGLLSKTGGSFKIDHPIDPANKYLSHSFVESPDMMNIYNGVVTLDKKGQAEVHLPNWFQALNRDFRYQLTCLGGFAPVYVSQEIRSNKFRIAGGHPDLRVSWMVTGIRHDAWADAHRIQVEETKPDTERGISTKAEPARAQGTEPR